MRRMVCRACGHLDGALVLDLGKQPACDYFPARDAPLPDPVYPLQMWLCSRCGLAQLVEDPTVPEEPRGTEPAALTEQAKDAVRRIASAGWLRPGARVCEYGSPHGGSWLPLLTERGMVAAEAAERADVVLDCFGLMHCPDQVAGLSERARRVARGGVLLLQYHSLATIVRLGQWNSLRHGHYAYYSTSALMAMLAMAKFRALSAWRFDLYGGTVLLAAMREADTTRPVGPTVHEIVSEEEELRLRDTHSVGSLQRCAESNARALHDWLRNERDAGRTVVGYGAASRAVALLCRAGVDGGLLLAVADASRAKQGRRMPGTDIPVISPQRMIAASPDAVLLFVPDLREEVRAQFPAIEASGGRWVTLDDLA